MGRRVDVGKLPLWAQAQAQAKTGAGKPRRSKYNAKRVEVDGIKFDSQREALRYGQLKRLQAAGDVVRFMLQVPFNLPGGVRYLLDFLVDWSDGSTTYEDVKGMDTPVSKLKRKQVEQLYSLRIDLI